MVEGWLGGWEEGGVEGDDGGQGRRWAERLKGGADVFWQAKVQAQQGERRHRLHTVGEIEAEQGEGSCGWGAAWKGGEARGGKE